MSTLGLMRSRISVLTNHHISDADIDVLINRAHHEEVESGEWSYRQRHLNIASHALASGGTVSIASGATQLIGVGTAFTQADIGRHVRLGGATSNAMPIEIADIELFATPLNSAEYTVDNVTAQGIVTTFGGVQATSAVITILGDNIRYTIDGVTTPTPSIGTLILNGSSLPLSGHTNLDNFQVIAESGTAQVFVTAQHSEEKVLLAQAWPGATITNGTYELFQRYYALPANVDIVQQINHGDAPLTKKTTYEFDLSDPSRQETSDRARHWAPAGIKATGEKLIELWPITTVSEHYSVDYLIGHTTLVDSIDRSIAPAPIIEHRVMVDACSALASKTGDMKWLQIAQFHEARYQLALERMMAADASRFGQLEQVLDLEGLNGGVYYDNDYIALHDV